VRIGWNRMWVSLLTGGHDPHYAIPLAAPRADTTIHVQFFENDTLDILEQVLC
jgi:hypothetical protein